MQTFRLWSAAQVLRLIGELRQLTFRPGHYWRVTLERVEPKRTLEQNAKWHAMLADIACQVTYCGQKWDAEQWKRIVLAGVHGQTVIQNPFGDGEIVVNCKRSRGLAKREMSDIIEALYAWGVEQNVIWSEPRSEWRKAA